MEGSIFIVSRHQNVDFFGGAIIMTSSIRCGLKRQARTQVSDFNSQVDTVLGEEDEFGFEHTDF